MNRGSRLFRTVLVGVVGVSEARAVDYAIDLSPGYARVPNAPSLNPTTITVEAWIMFPSTTTGSPANTGNDAVIDKPYVSHDAPYYQYHIGVSALTYVNTPGTMGFNVAVNGQGKGTGLAGQYVPGEWFHVAGTFDGNVATFYRNGVAVSADSSPGVLNSYNTDLFIGRFGNLNFTTNVVVDELRIWDHARTGEEIRGWMHGTLSGAEAGLVAYYDFNSPGTTTLVDRTAGHHDGVLTDVSLGDFVATGAPISSLPGDANADGRVDGDDLALIDRGFATHAIGWSNGDFNRDGAVDGADYVIIDTALAGGGIPATGVLPEPGLAILAWATFALQKRKRG